MVTYPEIRMYIDGVWCAGGEGCTETVVCPSTGQVIGRYPIASMADIDRATAAAARAFPIWRDMPLAKRINILKAAAGLLRQRIQQIGEIMSLEQGKPLKEAAREVMRAADTLDWNAEEARRSYGRIIPSDHNMILNVVRQPIGPVAAFVPWNFPASGPVRKLAPALSAGCSIILKASEQTPGTACQVLECFEQAGVPAGVINLVFGDPPMISQQLIASPLIRMIAFTGSVPVGKLLMEQAARVMKPTLMELGGHAPVIVCADADPVKAAQACAEGKFANAGQVCTSPTRFIIHDSIHDRFVAELTKAAQGIRLGNEMAGHAQMGPLISLPRLQKLSSLVDEAIAAGAHLETGGRRSDRQGWFYEPTVLSDVPHECRIMQEEPFGPVALVVRFSDLDHAITLANSLPYGLAAYAFTQSAAIAQELVRRLDVGVMSINHTTTSLSQAPSGGVKESGHGREGGSETLDAYLVTKRVSHKLI